MSRIRSVERYGWVRDLPDQRDKITAPPSSEDLALVAANPVVDLSTSPFMPPVWNQGQLGSCEAHSTGCAYLYAALASGKTLGTPSRLFIYYHARLIEGTVDQDAGSSIRDGFKVISTGVPPETDWPYDIKKFADAPPKKAETDAEAHKATLYTSVPQVGVDIKTQLVGASARPVSFGFTVYESFESAEVAHSGVVPIPKRNESVVGGHAVVIVGYDEELKRYKVRNSWGSKETDGTEWGFQGSGYFFLPYEYVENQGLASDFWVAEVAT